jgi:hypothetical protein
MGDTNKLQSESIARLHFEPLAVSSTDDFFKPSKNTVMASNISGRSSIQTRSALLACSGYVS